MKTQRVGKKNSRTGLVVVLTTAIVVIAASLVLLTTTEVGAQWAGALGANEIEISTGSEYSRNSTSNGPSVTQPSLD